MDTFDLSYRSRNAARAGYKFRCRATPLIVYVDYQLDNRYSQPRYQVVCLSASLTRCCLQWAVKVVVTCNIIRFITARCT